MIGWLRRRGTGDLRPTYAERQAALARARERLRHQQAAESRRRAWLHFGLPVITALAFFVGLAIADRVAARSVAARPELFVVKRLEIEGTRRLDAAALARAVLPAGAPAPITPQEVAARLEAHPWIARVAVARLAPGTVVARIEEHEPAALACAVGEARLLVNEQGVAFANAEGTAWNALPQLVVAGLPPRDRRDPLLAQGVALARAVAEAGFAGIELSLDGEDPERAAGIARRRRAGTHPARRRRPGAEAREPGAIARGRRDLTRCARDRSPLRGASGVAARRRPGTGERRPDARRGHAGSCDRRGGAASCNRRPARRKLAFSRAKEGVRGMARKEDLIVGLDIGTTKICAIVAERTEDGVDVVGIGTHPSRGLRKGVVVDIDATVESIKHAVEEAELMSDCEISSVYAGIAGGHIRGFNSHGIVAVKDHEVSEGDVRRVIDAAKAVAIPMDREVIHVIPQEFVIDEQDGIREPLGMSGVRLEAKIHIVTAAVTSAQNIVKCANKAGLNVIDIVLEPLASAEAVLAGDERELGVCLIDIGGGTTDLAVFCDGSIAHTSVLALGGNHITNDIAVGLRTPFDEAERTKKRFGVASARLLGSDDILSVSSVGGRRPREVSRKLLCEIIEPRVEEILSLARQELMRARMEDRIPSGIVLSGGCAALAGIADLAEEIFESPVRVGLPARVGGLQDVVRDPMYATGVGLALYGANHGRGLPYSRFRIRDESIFRRVRQRMREWFHGEFD